MNHLKVFGCVSYVHIESNDRSKLNDKARKCFFISYGDEQFGYHFWDDQNWKIIRSRNVVFYETALYKDKSSGSTDAIDTTSKKSKIFSLDIHEVTPQDQPVDMGIPVVPQNGAEPSTLPTILRRSTRFIRVPDRYSPSLDYILLTDSGEPESYKATLQDENSNKWELAMKDEMDSILGNQTWDLVELSKEKKVLHNKWVYRLKNEHDGSKRYKAKLVVKGFK